MKYKIIDNAIPHRIGYYLFDMLCKENIWSLSLNSNQSMYKGSEPMLPGSMLMADGKSLNVNTFVEGFLKSTFLSIICDNNLHFTELRRILCNANYPKSVLDYHTDIDDNGYETMVLFVTPNLENLGCGIMIDKDYIDYKFCRAVIFNSKTPHTAVSPQKEIPLPRLSVGFMFKVYNNE